MIFRRDTWSEILSSVTKNKARTTITVIGVLWGIFIYITLSGAAKGLDNGFERQFERVAMNSMFVWTQQTSVPYKGFKTGRFIQLKLNDVRTLKTKIPEIQYVAPRNAKGVFGGDAPTITKDLKHGKYNVYGDFPVVVKIATKDIYDGGRFLNEEDIKHDRKVCVIGERTQRELFNKNENPVGQFIKIDNSYFQVIGVHKFVQGGGFEDDGDIYIPFTTFRKLYNTGENVGCLLYTSPSPRD